MRHCNGMGSEKIMTETKTAIDIKEHTHRHDDSFVQLPYVRATQSRHHCCNAYEVSSRCRSLACWYS
jgi:hypothetical protein